MLIDVHTHTPRHRERPQDEPDGSFGTVWRPGQAIPTSLTWADHLEAMEPVDRAIVFNIAADPRGGPSTGRGSSSSCTKRGGSTTTRRPSCAPTRTS